MTAVLTILSLGFLLGLRHATDSDHVVAVTTLVSRERSVVRASLLGLLWGLGHTVTIAVVGGTIAGMMTITSAMAVPVAWSQKRFHSMDGVLRYASGGLSLVFGAAMAVALITTACSSSSGSRPVSAAVPFVPDAQSAHFATAITHPYFPVEPGTTWRYRGTGGLKNRTEIVSVDVEPRTVMGIPARVVHDQLFENGKVIEETDDWYAQDERGDVWRLGADTKQLQNGHVVASPASWEAAVGGAEPGIIMWANPAVHPGEPYRQEWLQAAAETVGRVVNANVKVKVPYGKMTDCVHIEETSTLDPGVKKQKFYCPGVGLAKVIQSGRNAMELVAMRRP